MPPQDKFDPPKPDCFVKPNPPNFCAGQQHGATNTSSEVATNSATMKKNDEKDMDFDELLPHVGEFGFYQRVLFVLMIPFAFFVAWVYFSQIFITLVPEGHWCRVPELENLTVEERFVDRLFKSQGSIDFFSSKFEIFGLARYSNILPEDLNLSCFISILKVSAVFDRIMTTATFQEFHTSRSRNMFTKVFP